MAFTKSNSFCFEKQMLFLFKAIAFLFKANAFSKRKRKRQRKKSPTPPIKEKEKEKEKDDDDSYVRMRACACVRGLAEKKKGNAVFRHCPCVLSETFSLLTFIYDYLLLVAILNLELHNASHWHIVWDERHQLCNYLVHVTETDVLHFA